MFQEMRLKEQALSKEETEAMLSKATHGTLAISGKDGYPYSVPVSFVYKDDKLYFHGAVAGKKYDLLTSNPQVLWKREEVLFNPKRGTSVPMKWILPI